MSLPDSCQSKSMSQHFSVSESDGQKFTSKNDSLLTAIKQGEADLVLQILSDGAFNVNTCYNVHELPDHEGLSPLMIACIYGRCETAKLLLDHGARVDLQDSIGWSALMHTVRCGHFNTVELLLHYGADVDLQSIKWESARSLVLSTEDSEMFAAVTVSFTMSYLYLRYVCVVHRLLNTQEDNLQLEVIALQLQHHTPISHHVVMNRLQNSALVFLPPNTLWHHMLKTLRILSILTLAMKISNSYH